MNIFDIDKHILECVDLETGEIIDPEKLEALEMEREKKIEGCGMWYKDCLAQAAAIKEEADKLTARAAQLTKKAESIKAYLEMALNGEKFKSDRVVVSYRKSEQVEIGTDFDWTTAPDEYLSFKDPAPNKTAIKKALKAGTDIAGCKIVSKMNIQIG